MRKRVKDGALVFCLFMFLLIVLGGGLRLNPGGALMAAATGTPLLIYVFHCLIWCDPLRSRSSATIKRLSMTKTPELSAVADSSGAVTLSHNLAEGQNASVPASHSETIHAIRRHLPDERRAITHHFSIAGQEGYITVGVYEDGSPGEMFVRMAKEGSIVSGLMDAFATVVSLALQHGVPLSVLCGKLSHMRFEPSGWSGNPQIGYAKSLMDYIARWLELKFLNSEQAELFPPLRSSEDGASTVGQANAPEARPATGVALRG